MLNPSAFKRSRGEAISTSPHLLLYARECLEVPWLENESAFPGARLTKVTVPKAASLDPAAVRGEIRRHCPEEELVPLDVVLAFADEYGPANRLAARTVPEVQQVFAENVLALKVFFDELFTAFSQVKQICVLVPADETLLSAHPSFSLALSGLEMMVQLYAAEMLNTHFLLLRVNPGREPSPEDLLRVIRAGRQHPTGRILDQSGQPLNSVLSPTA